MGHGGAMRTHAIHQAQNTNGCNAEYGNFAEGIETTEVDQNHIHHIGSAAQRNGLLQEEP